MPENALPIGVSVTQGASFVPCCDICGWIGRDYWTHGDAKRAAWAHTRSNLHHENAPKTALPTPPRWA